jgi:hypothetical protein
LERKSNRPIPALWQLCNGREFKEDELVKTAIKQLLVVWVGICISWLSSAQAQQQYAPKELARYDMLQGRQDNLRFAQQPHTGNQLDMLSQPQIPVSPLENVPSEGNLVPNTPLNTLSNNPQTATNGQAPTMPGNSHGTPQPEEGQITAGFPGLTPSGQPAETVSASDDCMETGLWDGCDAPEGCSVCGGGYCQPPLWFTDQGVRIISRGHPRMHTLGSQPEFVGYASTGTPVYQPKNVFDTRKASYNVAPGYYATIGRYLGRDSQDRDDFMEFTYWGMNTWTDSVFFNGERTTNTSLHRSIQVGNISSPFPSNVGGFNRADSQELSVSSEMHNWELNFRMRPRGRPDQLVLQPNGRWRRECSPGTYMSYLVGLRYMTVGDGSLWTTRGLVVDSATPTVQSVTSGRYEVRTENDLLGLQIGTDIIFRRCKWSWGVHAKVGPYLNFSKNVQDISTQTAGDPLSTIAINDHFHVLKQRAAMIGETGFEANYKFTPNFTGRASYDFMWITGLALAPEQMQYVPNPGPSINTNGSLFCHGVTLGLEWNW